LKRLEFALFPPVVTVIASLFAGSVTEADEMLKIPFDHAPAVAESGDREPVVLASMVAPE
jgi:hypothetical protein